MQDNRSGVEKILQTVAVRLLKIVANGLKAAFYLHYKLRPNKRYEIPAVSKPFRTPCGEKKIPRIVWQTNHTNRVTLSLYCNYLFNRLMTSTFEYRYQSDADCDAFVAEYFAGEINERYRSLQVGAAKADFWRILVLYQFGGIYIDIDANMSWPAERFLAAEQEDLFLEIGGEITNYFLASAPGNAVLADIRDIISRNIAENTLSSVYTMTGPTVVDKVVREHETTVRPYKQIATQGQFTNKFLQYVDKKRGAWTLEQADKSIVG